MPQVWVTRDEAPDGSLSVALRAEGLTPVNEPVLSRRVVGDATAAVSCLCHDDWLVLTSVFAIEAVAEVPARVPRVAVVGEVSRQAAIARGFRVELVGRRGDAKGLFAELRGSVAQGKVCYPRSSLVDPPEPWANVEVLSPVLYETLPRDFDHSVVDRVDAVTVASPSAVDAIQASGLDLHGLHFASIGPSTSAALRRHGIEPTIEAPKRSFESLARAVVDYLGGKNG